MSTTFHPDPARTRVLAERWGSWVLPYWLERQADPRSPAFSPAPPVGGVTNCTALDRVRVGTLDGATLATTDPRGLVTFEGGTWSLDWWIGADDRWHLPSREPAVRQRLVDGAPVVETAMRVPGGDLVQRVWAARDSVAGEVVVVELENASRLPVAVAVSLRPYGPDGAGRIDQIEVLGDRVLLDGHLALWLPKAASRLALSTLGEGDVADVVLCGDAPDRASGSIACPAGFATAALVYPLTHTATLRWIAPVAPRDEPAPASVPPHDAVARGWASHLASGARIELPDAELGEMLAAARAQLVLAAAGRQLAGETSTVETAAIVGALDRLGDAGRAAAIVATLPMGQGTGGRLGGADPDAAATGAALVAAGRHWRMTRDDRLLAEIAGPLAAGGHHHLRGRGFGWRGRSERDSVLDLGWRLRGILDAAAALAPGQPDAAAALETVAHDVRLALDEAVDSVTSVDAATVEAMALVAPLGVVGASSPFATLVLDWVRIHASHGGGVAQLRGATGLSPVLTSLVGRVELRRGEPSALDRLGWFTRVGGPTRTWPHLVHPRLETACGGDGASPAAAAAFVELLLDLLVHESFDGLGLVFCPVWPDSWLGAGVEAHGLRTTLGTVSFAIRWHGHRPALLWELEPHQGVDSVRLTIPGLDPTWSSTELRGEALLAAPSSEGAFGEDPSSPGPGETTPAEGDSFA